MLSKINSLTAEEVKESHLTFTFISDLKSILKFIVLVINVLPVVTGFWLATFFTGVSLSEQLGLFFITIIGSAFVIAGALVINNWYDVDIDAVMKRTKNRPTVTGNFSLKSVLRLGISLTIIGFIFMAFTSVEAFIFSVIGWVVYVFPYTMWTKRKYTFNTVIGSISGAVTPLIGWGAITSTMHMVPLMLALFIFIWQMPHTYAIAMRRYDEYKAAKVAMLPVVYGFNIAKWHSFVYILFLLPIPFLLPQLGTTFIVVSTMLTLAWVGYSLYGFIAKDEIKWAKSMFLFSVNHLMFIFILMIIVTLPIFS